MVFALTLKEKNNNCHPLFHHVMAISPYICAENEQTPGLSLCLHIRTRANT